MSHSPSCTCNVPETCTDTCDGCGQRAEGRTHYANCAPVLHLCHACGNTEPEPTEPESDDCDAYDDSMDGDHDSAMASAGFGTDEDYGCFGGDADWF